MKKISTDELLTRELRNELRCILSCCDFDDYNIRRYVVGRDLENLLRVTDVAYRADILAQCVSEPDFGDIKSWLYDQMDGEFFISETCFEIDLGSLRESGFRLETPSDFSIRKVPHAPACAYYSIDFGAHARLDSDKLERLSNEWLAANGVNTKCVGKMPARERQARSA